MASKARDLSNFISTAAIDASEIGTGAITTDKIADTTITHAKLHTTMDLSGKTVTLPTINALDVTNNINVGGTVDGVDIQTLNTTAGAALPKVGGTMTGDTSHGDNVKAKFGTGGDLEIYHDGSNSYIKDAGTGQLRIVTNGSEIAMLTQGGSEYGLRVIQDGAVEMRHNDSTKLATTSTGIDVTGIVTSDGLDSSQKIVSGKTAGQYGAVAEFKAEGSGVKLRIDDNSNASATTRMYIMHNYNRDSGSETCDSSSTGQAAIKFDNGSITFATAAAGNTTAPSNRMAIDNAGIVTKPNQPIISVSRDNNGLNMSTNEDLFASTSMLNWVVQGITHNTSNGRFTVPVAGKYYIHFYSMKKNAVVAYFQVKKNGADTLGLRIYETSAQASGVWHSYGLGGVFTLAANDYINVVCASGGTEVAHGQKHMNFTIHLIG